MCFYNGAVLPEHRPRIALLNPLVLRTILWAVQLIFAGCSWAETGAVRELKPLFLDTMIVEGSVPRSVLVTPGDRRYEHLVSKLQERIWSLCGINLAVYTDEQVPHDLLERSNVITIGNMADNAFIEKLYREWRVILDLKYPGPGGYTVRTLHNPYGTGHNVIFVGGSDLTGVERAMEAFLTHLQPVNPLKVGWIMDIQLGAGVTPPSVSPDLFPWNVHSWRDSWRSTRDGTETGYKPSTYFGWNPVSIAGVLYYMTGREKDLQTFKSVSMPNPARIPKANLSDHAFTDPLNPLVKCDHYRSHIVPLVYDLIEESPLFTDQERLYISNRLLEHQLELDPHHTFSESNATRHGLWHMMAIYTGSRYFATYYPDLVWNKRLENVRRAFSTLIGNPTWGERDTLHWVATSIEPIFEFFLMDGYTQFVESGTARTLMKGLEILMTGEPIDFYNQNVSISLLHQAAHMLGDTRYVWMLRQLGFDFDVFRIGQSYWHASEAFVEAPLDLIGKAEHYPVARSEWEKAGGKIPMEESFQVLSYRGGLSAADDYFLLDGFYGLGRNPHHLGTLTRLRLFNGRQVLNGYANDVDVWFNGAAGSDIPLSAALKSVLATKETAFVHIEVPNMPSSLWDRRVVYAKDNAVFVIDRLEPREAGVFDAEITWQFAANIRSIDSSGRQAETINSIYLESCIGNMLRVDAKTLREHFRGRLNPGESLVFVNKFTVKDEGKRIQDLGGGAYVISGDEDRFLSVGKFTSATIRAKADFTYMDPGRILLENATELVLDGLPVVKSSKPVTIDWSIARARLTLAASQETSLRVASPTTFEEFRVGGSRKRIELATSTEHQRLGDLIGQQIRKVSPLQPTTVRSATDSPRDSLERIPGLRSHWRVELGGEVSTVAHGGEISNGSIWVGTNDANGSRLVKLSGSGKVLHTIQADSAILSLLPARTTKQRDAYSVLVGFKNDWLRAYSEKGEIVWQAKSEIDPSFRIGDRYEAPWFTDPGPENRMTGVFSLLAGELWGDEGESVVLGRPCTLEFRSLGGELIRRLPTRWGNNTSLALLKKTDFAGGGPMVLAGKSYTGIPQLSGVNRDYAVVSNTLFGGLPPGGVSMDAWLQRGLSHMAVVDLDGDGAEEVVYALSGHWNEVRAYDGKSGKPLWLRNLGPDQAGGAFIRGLAVLGADKQGPRKIAVATKAGWVCAFDRDGNPSWQSVYPSAIKTLLSIEAEGGVAVGLEDARLVLLDGEGNRREVAQLDSAVNVMDAFDDQLFAGTAGGRVECFLLKPSDTAAKNELSHGGQ